MQTAPFRRRSRGGLHERDPGSESGGRGENAVARDIRDAFRAQLPAGQFHVETDDGEDVLVKKASGQPNFLLELVSNGVEHVRLKPQRE